MWWFYSILKSHRHREVISFLYHACVCACACVHNSFSSEAKRRKQRGGKEIWGRGISVIVDFVNPWRSFQRGVERRIKPKNIQNQKYPPRLRFPSTKEKCSLVPLAPNVRIYIIFPRRRKKGKKKKHYFPSNLKSHSVCRKIKFERSSNTSHSLH